MKNYFFLLILLIGVFTTNISIWAHETIIRIKPNKPECVQIIYDDGSTASLNRNIADGPTEKNTGYYEYKIVSSKKIANAKEKDCSQTVINIDIIRLMPLPSYSPWWPPCWFNDCPKTERVSVKSGILGPGGVQNKPQWILEHGKILQFDPRFKDISAYKNFTKENIASQNVISLAKDKKTAALLEKQGIKIANVKQVTAITNKTGEHYLNIDMNDRTQLQVLPKEIDMSKLKDVKYNLNQNELKQDNTLPNSDKNQKLPRH